VDFDPGIAKDVIGVAVVALVVAVGGLQARRLWEENTGRKDRRRRRRRSRRSEPGDTGAS
jgi:hypothetical protein